MFLLFTGYVFSYFIEYSVFSAWQDKLLAQKVVLADMACPMWYKANNLKETVVKLLNMSCMGVRNREYSTEYFSSGSSVFGRIFGIWLSIQYSAKYSDLAKYLAKVIPNIQIRPKPKKFLSV